MLRSRTVREEIHIKAESPTPVGNLGTIAYTSPISMVNHLMALRNAPFRCIPVSGHWERGIAALLEFDQVVAGEVDNINLINKDYLGPNSGARLVEVPGGVVLRRKFGCGP